MVRVMFDVSLETPTSLHGIFFAFTVASSTDIGIEISAIVTCQFRCDTPSLY
jgi:hypothetical protein